MAILLIPFCLHAHKDFQIYWFRNLLYMSEPDKGCSINAPCAIHYISTILFHLLPMICETVGDMYWVVMIISLVLIENKKTMTAICYIWILCRENKTMYEVDKTIKMVNKSTYLNLAIFQHIISSPILFSVVKISVRASSAVDCVSSRRAL